MNRVSVAADGNLECARCMEDARYTANKCGRCNHEWVSTSTPSICPNCKWATPSLSTNEPWHYAADNVDAYATNLTTNGTGPVVRPKVKTVEERLTDMGRIIDMLAGRMTQLEYKTTELTTLVSTLVAELRSHHATLRHELNDIKGFANNGLAEVMHSIKDLIEELSE
jgi:hypothetical protein